MSSREVAELTGKEHRNVVRDIRQMLQELGEGGLLRFEQAYSDPQNGQTYPMFSLPKRETLNQRSFAPITRTPTLAVLSSDLQIGL